MIEQIQTRLQKDFPDGEIEIRDYKHDGTHMVINISSAKFKNLSLIEQHKLVYAALSDLMQSGELHAVKIKTTPL